MSTREILQSDSVKIIAIVIGILLIILMSFGAGVKVGLRKAKFSYAFGQNYERNFAGGEQMGKRDALRGPMKGMMPGGPGEENFRNGHGTAGEVISVSGDTIVIKDKDNQEGSIRINDATIINRGRDAIQVSDIKTGERIVVIGKPSDDGTIGAHLIRVFDTSQKAIINTP